MQDLISRQAAIEYLMTNMNWYDEDGYESDDDYKRECITDLINGVPSAQPEWNNHTVACLLAKTFGDDCACNFNGIDEWLPLKCDFAETCCPHPVGVACWEQYLKHRSDRRTDE